MPNDNAWILAARPKTLPAAVGPVLVGSALAFADDGFGLTPALAAMFVALLLQVGVNLANDYFDGIKGVDTRERLGPVRVTQSGLISPAGVRSAMILIFCLAAVIGLYLMFIGGWPVIAMGMAAIAAAVAYSGGPYPLASHGLGDLFVFLFFGLVAVCGTYYVQTLKVTPMAFAMAAAVGLPITAILVVNNLRDMHTDRAAGKHTLAVFLGERRSKLEYGLLLGIAYALLPLVWIGGGASAWVLLPFLSLPWAVALVKTVQQSRIDPGLNLLLAQTARMSLVFSTLLALGLVVGKIL